LIPTKENQKEHGGTAPGKTLHQNSDKAKAKERMFSGKKTDPIPKPRISKTGAKSRNGLSEISLGAGI
jgi:hypothetical protein